VDGGLPAEVASVGEAVEVTAKGEATAGVSVGFDVPALHFFAGFGGHGGSCGGFQAQKRRRRSFWLRLLYALFPV
jgi:hypothetical protein